MSVIDETDTWQGSLRLLELGVGRAGKLISFERGGSRAAFSFASALIFNIPGFEVCIIFKSFVFYNSREVREIDYQHFCAFSAFKKGLHPW